jgi:hypothetical protein
MFRLYLFYIKAEDVYRLSRNGALFFCRIEWPIWPCQSLCIAAQNVSTLSRQRHHDGIGIVAGASARATGSWSIQCLQAQAGQPTNPVPMNSSSGNNS